MGIYAEAAIWAEINGRDPSDMSAEDWMGFYDDYDDRECVRSKKRKYCSCGKSFKSNSALSNHKRDKGCTQ